MTTKHIKDIQRGDRIKLVDSGGTAVVKSISKSRLFRSSGGCWCIDLKVDGGPNKGEWIKDQHYPGDTEVELA